MDSLSSHPMGDRKSTRLNSSHGYISYAVFCLKKKNNNKIAKSRDATRRSERCRGRRRRAPHGLHLASPVRATAYVLCLFFLLFFFFLKHPPPHETPPPPPPPPSPA